MNSVPAHLVSISDHAEIRPGRKRIKRTYVAIAMFLFGRAFQAGAKVDPGIREEFDSLPGNFLLDLCVAPGGPRMLVEKTPEGKVLYRGQSLKGRQPTLTMKIKHLEAAMMLFTFMESTCVANARNRIVVDGDIRHALAVVRIMNRLEVFLLPKFLAKLGVKRYPVRSQLPSMHKYIGRAGIYLRLITG